MPPDLRLPAARRLAWMRAGPDLVVSRSLGAVTVGLWIYPQTVVTLPACMIA